MSVELERKSLYIKNMYGVKSCFDVDVMLETEDKKIMVIKTWDKKLKRLKYNEEEKCYLIVDEGE